MSQPTAHQSFSACSLPKALRNNDITGRGRNTFDASAHRVPITFDSVITTVLVSLSTVVRYRLTEGCAHEKLVFRDIVVSFLNIKSIDYFVSKIAFQ